MCEDIRPLHPMSKEGGVVADRSGAAGSEEETMEQLKQKVKDLEEFLVDKWEYNQAGEDPVLTLRMPAKPSEQEWNEHQVTHTPPKHWCKYCLMGRGKRRPHRVNVSDMEPHEGGPNKLSIDYMYLND